MTTSKTCPRCGYTLDVAEFNWRDRVKGRLQPYCKVCSRQYGRDHYVRNTKYYVDKATARKGVAWRTLTQQVLKYLHIHPCVDCGETDPIVLEFDHSDPATKEWNVAHMIQRRHAWSTIALEIAKCDVRCANCHRRRTARQFDWYRLGPVAQLERATGFDPVGREFESLRGHSSSANLRAVVALTLALCLVLALSVWPPAVAQAAPAGPGACIAGLPPDLASQPQPLIQALGEAMGQSLNCELIQPDASGSDPPSLRQRELQLIAETLALLAMADPGYGYASPGFGYTAPGPGPWSPGYGYPAAGYDTGPAPAADTPATQPCAVPDTPPDDATAAPNTPPDEAPD
jgi:hypothetical protein